MMTLRGWVEVEPSRRGNESTSKPEGAALGYVGSLDAEFFVPSLVEVLGGCSHGFAFDRPLVFALGFEFVALLGVLEVSVGLLDDLELVIKRLRVFVVLVLQLLEFGRYLLYLLGGGCGFGEVVDLGVDAV